MMAVIIFPMIILLAVTSSDRAVNFLGISSWKWLHSSLIHVIFYIIVLRWILYAFFFFQPALPDLRMYPPIWFLYPFLLMALFAVILQATAFIKTVWHQRNTGDTQKSKLQGLILAGVGILFISPVALATSSVVFLDGRILKEDQTVARQQTPQNYARSFYMDIRDGNQTVSLWARNLDTSPDFRQTVSVNGSDVTHQIFISNERALYIAELGTDGNMVWSKTENVGPESIGLSNIVAGPASWASEYGVGERQIPVANGNLNVSIISVEEVLKDEIFAVPDDIK